VVPDILKKRVVFFVRVSRPMQNSFFIAFVMDPATLKMRATRVFETSGTPSDTSAYSRISEFSITEL
jgi:hypothetical protein